MGKIESFTGQYRFLSNFYPCSVFFEGITWQTAENAYQASRCANVSQRQFFITLSPKEAKKLGRTVERWSGWEEMKERIMDEIVHAKFLTNTELALKLIATGDDEIIEGNWWGDVYWGVCRGVGENKLGKILMKIRNELKEFM